MAEYFPATEPTANESIHNEDVRTFMAQIPPSIVRWGMTAFFIIMLLLIWLSSVVRYPDTVTLKCLLTAQHVPQQVKSRVDGRLVRLYVHENDLVREGQLLALLETAADHRQVQQLAAALPGLAQAVQTNQEASVLRFASLRFSQLGEIQQAFQGLIQQYTLYLPFATDGYYRRKKDLLRQEVQQAEQLQLILTKQSQLLQQDLTLAEQRLSTQQELYAQKVIPLLEYKQQQEAYLAKQMPVQQAKAQLIAGQAQRTAALQKLLEIDNAYMQQRAALQQSISYVQSLVRAWQQKYELTAPTAGRVHLPGLLQEKANVSANATVFTIGGDSARFFGFASVPQTYVGKIKQGQRVRVKFDGYPFYEFGFVEGKVGRLSTAPTPDSIFYAHIVFPHGLVTQYHTRLPFKQGLTAAAEIVLEERSLLQKFTYDINKVLYASH